MTLAALAGQAVERLPIPDAVTQFGIGYLVARADRKLAAEPPVAEDVFAAEMANWPIAVNTAEANAQHYEVPAAFFELVLGPHRKYSCCLYEPGVDSLVEAENQALAASCAHADLQDGQNILELGCGWGSLTLWMAQHYPASSITAVSNSRSQREAIEAMAQARGLRNVRVITCDMNEFQPEDRFDRVVSVEMFEHMANWRGLLSRVRDWLKPEGRMFMHVFTHLDRPYRYDMSDQDDWIAQHFFTGGIMPSHGLIRRFPDLFEVEEAWRWSGAHYQRTAFDWLDNFDRNIDAVREILAPVYGSDLSIWLRRWRVFFLATAGMFGHKGGSVWGVSHYRLKPVAA